MTTYQQLKRSAFGSMCRQCINEEYRLELKTEDCYYLPFPEPCTCCGKAKNIVGDVRRSWSWRLWLHRDKA